MWKVRSMACQRLRERHTTFSWNDVALIKHSGAVNRPMKMKVIYTHQSQGERSQRVLRSELQQVAAEAVLMVSSTKKTKD